MPLESKVAAIRVNNRACVRVRVCISLLFLFLFCAGKDKLFRGKHDTRAHEEERARKKKKKKNNNNNRI